MREFLGALTLDELAHVNSAGSASQAYTELFSLLVARGKTMGIPIPQRTVYGPDGEVLTQSLNPYQARTYSARSQASLRSLAAGARR